MDVTSKGIQVHTVAMGTLKNFLWNDTIVTHVI